MRNRKCDACNKTDKPVYPVYKVTCGPTVELERNELTGELQGKIHSYKCVECNKR